jgi:hypothetical protein
VITGKEEEFSHRSQNCEKSRCHSNEPSKASTTPKKKKRKKMSKRRSSFESRSQQLSTQKYLGANKKMQSLRKRRGSGSFKGALNLDFDKVKDAVKAKKKFSNSLFDFSQQLRTSDKRNYR